MGAKNVDNAHFCGYVAFGNGTFDKGYMLDMWSLIKRINQKKFIEKNLTKLRK